MTNSTRGGVIYNDTLRGSPVTGIRCQGTQLVTSYRDKEIRIRTFGESDWVDVGVYRKESVY